MPVIFKDAELPLILPPIDEYRPTEAGDPPLGRNKDFVSKNIELSTMPGWAGSSWYYLRYMDPKNSERLVGKDEENTGIRLIYILEEQNMQQVTCCIQDSGISS